jgi:pyrrolidone-carboxylate peptidase
VKASTLGDGARERRIAVLGFLPWTDAVRGVGARDNPSALAAERAASALASDGYQARFLGVPVSGEGIAAVVEGVVAFDPCVCVAIGQARETPRVERHGLVPGAWSAHDAASGPFVLVPDAEALAAHLSTLRDPAAATGPFEPSDDPGGYFCDHLCVELAIDARTRGTRAAFLHVPPIDGVDAGTREARVAQYARQAVAAVAWLLARAART